MPTEIDVKLAEDLAEHRLEVAERFDNMAERFGSIETTLAERFGSIETTLAGILEPLKLIRWLGSFFAGILAILAGSGVTLAWYSSGVVTEVRFQGRRLGEFQGRLDTISKQLDMLIGRAAAKAGGRDSLEPARPPRNPILVPSERDATPSEKGQQ